MHRRSVIAALLTLSLAGARPASAADDLLSRAVSCELKSSEVEGLLRALKKSTPGFARPSNYHSLPTFDVYTLVKPAAALGRRSTKIAIMPGRIGLVLDGVARAKVASDLRLQPDSLLQMSRRAIDDVRSIVAYPLSQAGEGMLFLGCEYGMPEASGWIE